MQKKTIAANTSTSVLGPRGGRGVVVMEVRQPFLLAR